MLLRLSSVAASGNRKTTPLESSAAASFARKRKKATGSAVAFKGVRFGQGSVVGREHDAGAGPVAVVSHGVRNDVNLLAGLQVVGAQDSVAVLDGALVGPYIAIGQVAPVPVVVPGEVGER
jgi:hypothetical protein